ncbi:MAG: nitroreductase family protein [Candidatus Korarchaeota archaeon]|nr:nitroreductase family protein [Candidatus Korarchaeota archaeon]
MSGRCNFLQFLVSRRSIRKFKDKPVPDDLILRILDAARFAPSAKNSQPWEFIIVKDRILKEKIGKIHKWASPLLGAPLAIVVACNREASPTSYLVDCANATMYIMLAAHALGLGTVWIQSLRNVEEIQELLKLPEKLIPVAILAVGWPDESPSPKRRKELKEIVHLDKYGRYWMST